MWHTLRINRVFFFHILFWLTYMALGGLMDFGRNPKHFSVNVLDMFFTQLPNMVVFYSCIAIYNKFIHPLRPLLLTGSLLCIYGLSLFMWFLNTHIVSAMIQANKATTSHSPYYSMRFCIEVLWLFIIYAFFAFGYYYFNKSIQHQKQIRMIESEKHHAEYAFLRAQINPHFLNNTLNFFYARSLPLSGELADGIMTLSEIMHYSLKVDHDDARRPIAEEITHIQNVININQLRFDHQLQIHFLVSGLTENIRIIPLVLITVVENILKHGNCTDTLHPVTITLNIDHKEGRVHLKTYNRKKSGPKELSSGIGIQNIAKRLNHFYGKNHRLSINETEIDYSLELTLNDLN